MLYVAKRTDAVINFHLISQNDKRLRVKNFTIIGKSYVLSLAGDV